MLPCVSTHPAPFPAQAGDRAPHPLPRLGPARLPHSIWEANFPIPDRRAQGLTWRFPPASERASPGACPAHRAPGRPPRQSARTAPLGTGKRWPQLLLICPERLFPTHSSHVEGPKLTHFTFKETDVPTIPKAKRQLELNRHLEVNPSAAPQNTLWPLRPRDRPAPGSLNSPAWATLRPLAFMSRRGRSRTSWASPSEARARSAAHRRSRAQLSATPSRRASCPSTAIPTLCLVPRSPGFPRPATCGRHQGY